MTCLRHTFLSTAHDIQGLFKGTHKFATFCSKLEKQALLDPIRYPVEDYLGNGLEFFVEVLLTLHPCDNRLGVYDYRPNQGVDNGVDGFGVNLNLEPSVVQIKYRADKSARLTATEDKLDSFISSALIDYTVVPDTTKPKNFRHFVFTTAQGLNHYTDAEKYKGKVKCFGYDDIRHLVDNNLWFWKQAEALVIAKPL